MKRAEALKVAAHIEAMQYRLYGERVAVIRDAAEEATKTGIIIPEQAQRKHTTGTLVMIGTSVLADQDEKGAKSEYHGLELGDWLTFSKYDGMLQTVELVDGTEIDLEILHGKDVYIGGKHAIGGKK